MRFNTQSVMRLALVAVAAASLAACATKPKPNPGPGEPPRGGPDQPYTPPGGPGPVDSRPIPGSSQDFIINVGDFVYFDLDSYDIRSDAMPVLDAQSAWLRRYPNVSIRIEGNADERGTREYNLALGSRRANAVKDYLVSRGVSPSRIMTLSNGKERPINPGTDEEAYQQNRNGQTIITSGGY
ncbi:MAG: peptidoglycan-associated lipoprotein Pal [Caulobacteraceae bacterium]|nr:peptidoglycan-associated lipoprotein Pal [Caulobacter sp.]RYF89841.1 MAG: peptidoglycan-associated lipoprotein Pal [Caulobacteraceae bacterium]